MGGTIDGQIFDNVTAEQIEELKRKTQQDIIPLSAKEAELAEQISPEVRAKLFRENQQDLEQALRRKAKELGIDIKETN